MAQLIPCSNMLRWLGAACVCVAAMVALQGCRSWDRAVLADHTRPGNIYLFPGIAGYGSQPMTSLATRFADAGYNAQFVSGDLHSLKVELLESRRSGLLRGPLILVGYSMGGADAIGLANDLNSDGLSVDGLILIDCFPSDLIPANVRSCHNVFLPGAPPMCLGGAVRAADTQTRLVNIDLADPAHRSLCAAGTTHWNLMNQPALLEHVAAAIEAYLEP